MNDKIIQKHLREIRKQLVKDWGEEPKGWDENDERYQVWKAYQVLSRYYLIKEQ